jgi:ribosomal protein S2
MGEIVNLRSVKKRLARTAEAAEARQNRVRHGRTKIEKANDQREVARRVVVLDGVKRETP